MSLVNDDSLDETKLKANKIKLALLLIIPFIVLGTAYVVFYSGVGIPSGTTNRGDLMQPAIQVQEQAYNTLDGKEYSFTPIWHLYVPISNDCSDRCEAALHTTRQVHLRQGKRAIKIDRIFVTTEQLTPSMQSFLKDNHPKSDVVQMDAQAWNKITSAAGYADGDYFLVDPRGWLMMAYRQEHKGEDLLKDLKKLLK